MQVEVAGPGAAASTAAPGVCPVCAGRGWVVAPDGGNGAARRCDCQKRDLGPLLLERARIPERYRHCRLENFKTGSSDSGAERVLKQALRRAGDYVKTFFDEEKKVFRTDGLLLIGTPGAGKTHLAAAILSEVVLRYRVRGLFVDFTELIARIQSTFDPSSEESAHRILEPLRRAELLVLDELGAQKPTEFVMNTLYLVINGRYTEQRPTIFTTNCKLEASARVADSQPAGHAVEDRAVRDAVPRRNVLVEDAMRSELLSERISARLVSRLYEMAPRPLVLPDRDYRRESAAGRRGALS